MCYTARQLCREARSMVGRRPEMERGEEGGLILSRYAVQMTIVKLLDQKAATHKIFQKPVRILPSQADASR